MLDGVGIGRLVWLVTVIGFAVVCLAFPRRIGIGSSGEVEMASLRKAALKRNLQIVWSETQGSRSGRVHRRRIAKARNDGRMGVFDRALGRFLTDFEVAGLDEHEIREGYDEPQATVS